MLPSKKEPRTIDEKLTTELPVRVYSPETAIQHPVILIRDLVRDMNAGRELAWRLFSRDLRAQYRQTYFGYVWAFLPPLVGAVTFIFLQSQGITNIEDTGLPYAAFAMMGTLLWQTFVESMTAPLTALSQAKPMLAKINFPRESILMASAYMVGFNFLIRLLLLVGVMVVWQVIPGLSVFLFPIFMLALVICGFSIGMILVPVGGLYGDVGKAIPIVAQFWMLLTPVVYPARTTGVAGWLAVWNPVSPLIVTARESLTNQPLSVVWPALAVAGLATLVLTFGLIAFRLIMPHLIARMGG